ncbi:hypothetical protein ITP53_15915 [Nonomuraea sp. K274]|uniref:Uncharacterized protein n=1 Tax=Nonomuraea cypriaca TaxID=1187855 RepID=A0A931ABY4_9ACTN|nr:hypothetical protein [Nonomuraea cypriaca]MBF8187195.1 hypothetical protein [Nonomuraea cypriaca]
MTIPTQQVTAERAEQAPDLEERQGPTLEERLLRAEARIERLRAAALGAAAEPIE